MIDTAPKTLFLIVGLPRSGTSSIAQFLDHLGVYFGDPAHFLDTAVFKHNPIFYELQWINDFNDRVMAAWNTSYTEDVMPADCDFDRPELRRSAMSFELRMLQEFGDRPRIGIKDPRICFTFPLWQKVLMELGYEIRTILSLRSPSAILSSNRALTPGRTSRWQRFYARHLLAVSYFTRDVFVCRFDFDRLMQDPLQYGQSKAAELGLAIPDPQAATRHLSREHYHHQPDATGTGDPYVDRIDSEVRDGRLDPLEYLRFRAVALLFIGDLREQDEQIKKALDQKDSYIHDIEGFNKQAIEAIALKDQHIGKLETLVQEAAKQVRAAEQVCADVAASKDQHIAKLELLVQEGARQLRAAEQVCAEVASSKDQHIAKLELLVREAARQRRSFRHGGAKPPANNQPSAAVPEIPAPVAAQPAQAAEPTCEEIAAEKDRQIAGLELLLQEATKQARAAEQSGVEMAAAKGRHIAHLDATLQQIIEKHDSETSRLQEELRQCQAELQLRQVRPASLAVRVSQWFSRFRSGF